MNSLLFEIIGRKATHDVPSGLVARMKSSEQSSLVSLKEISILVVEDDSEFVIQLAESLALSRRARFNLENITTLEQAIKRVKSDGIDVVLLDLTLPDSPKEMTFKNFLPHASHLPVVIMSGHDDEDLAMDTMQSGAQDYLVKGQVNLSLIVRVIHHSIERKHLELSLLERDAVHRLITENALDMIAVFNRDGKPLYQSPSYNALFGRSESEQSNDPGTRFHTDDSSALQDLLDLMVETGQGQRTEFRLIRNPGDLRYIESQGSVVANAVGEISQLVLVSRDITDRRRAEERLRENEALYQSLVKSLPQCIMRKDREGRFTFVNENFARLLQLTPEEILGKTDFDFYPPDLARKYHSDDLAVMETGEIFEVTEENITSDGARHFMHVIKTPISGRASGIQVIFWDVTETKLKDIELRKSEKTLQAIMDQTPAVIYLKDPEGRYVYINRRYEQLFHLRRTSTVGHTDFDIFPRETAERFRENDRAILGNRTAQSIDESVPQNDGDHEYLSIKFPLLDENGEPFALCGISTDITDRKRAEQELRDKNKELKHTLLQLSNARLQLEQAQRLKSIGTLAAGVAHEVKNPLQILSFGIDNVALETQSVFNGDLNQTLDDMRDAVKRANTIIRDLLDFSRLEELDLRPMSVVELLENALRLERINLSTAGVRVETSFKSNIPRVALDKQKMQQVFINLIGNAIDASSRGGLLSIRVFSRFACPDDQTGLGNTSMWHSKQMIVVIEFEDCGEGISADVLPHIFDPFLTTKAVGQGTGLGLPVAQNIVALHGGKIHIANRLSKGARVTIKLKSCK